MPEPPGPVTVACFPVPVGTPEDALQVMVLSFTTTLLTTPTPPIEQAVDPAKFEPLMVSAVVELPDAGLMELTTGIPVKVNVPAITLPPEAVTTTDLAPDAPALGQVTVRLVVLLTVTEAPTPPTVTDTGAVKLVPVKKKVVPVIPLAGLGAPDVGAGGGGVLTVNATDPEVPPEVVTVIVLAPAAIDGMVTVAEVDDDTEIVAAVPLTLQVVPPTTKFVPVRVADDPARPLVGETPESVGAG